jgi:hypothetical protein
VNRLGGGSGRRDSCPEVGGATVPYSQPTGGTAPPDRLVGGWDALSGVTPSRSGLATLFGSPPRPRIARRLLIGSERPAPVRLPRGWPSGSAGANPCVGPAPKATRSCRRYHAPAGCLREVFAGQTTPVECQADAQSQAACNGQGADDAQAIHADPHLHLRRLRYASGADLPSPIWVTTLSLYAQITSVSDAPSRFSQGIERRRGARLPA